MIRILGVSDEVDGPVAAARRRHEDIDVVVGCGDVPFDVLDAIVAGADTPVVFVPGNHDPDLSGFRQARSGLTLRAGLPQTPPWPDGAVNADGRVVDVAGLRVVGLGGCRRYREGPNQYGDGQDRRRAARLVRAARWRTWRDGRTVDVVVAHAPPLGLGDGEDPAHRGLASLRRLVEVLRPRVLLHGHVQPMAAAFERRLGDTRVVNVFGHRVVELDIEPLPTATVTP